MSQLTCSKAPNHQKLAIRICNVDIQGFVDCTSIRILNPNVSWCKKDTAVSIVYVVYCLCAGSIDRKKEDKKHHDGLHLEASVMMGGSGIDLSSWTWVGTFRHTGKLRPCGGASGTDRVNRIHQEHRGITIQVPDWIPNSISIECSNTEAWCIVDGPASPEWKYMLGFRFVESRSTFCRFHS